MSSPDSELTKNVEPSESSKPEALSVYTSEYPPAHHRPGEQYLVVGQIELRYAKLAPSWQTGALHAVTVALTLRTGDKISYEDANTIVITHGQEIERINPDQAHSLWEQGENLRTIRHFPIERRHGAPMTAKRGKEIIGDWRLDDNRSTDKKGDAANMGRLMQRAHHAIMSELQDQSSSSE